jgi:hypothetical protein
MWGRRGVGDNCEYKEDYENLTLAYHYFEKRQVKCNPKIVISLSSLLTRTRLVDQDRFSKGVICWLLSNIK